MLEEVWLYFNGFGCIFIHVWIFHLTITRHSHPLSFVIPLTDCGGFVRFSKQKLWDIVTKEWDYFFLRMKTKRVLFCFHYRVNMQLTSMMMHWFVCHSLLPPTNSNKKQNNPSISPAIPCLFPFSILSPKCHSLTFLFSFFQSFNHHPGIYLFNILTKYIDFYCLHLTNGNCQFL